MKNHSFFKRSHFVLLVAAFLILPYTADSQTFFLGDGGALFNIVVNRPTGTALAEGDDFVLDFIQNLLIANFNKYTAIRAGAQIPEAGGRAGLLLTGRLTRIGHNFSLELSVTDPTTGLGRASFLNANTPGTTILNGTVVNQGFMHIAEQLGVSFTEAGIASITSPRRDDVQALLNLARGNMAERRGNPIEMFTHLFNAAAYDPSLLEAIERLDVLSRTLASGDAGEAIRMDIADRDRWLEILNEFDSFYHRHPPFTLTFNPHPVQKGHTDFENRTAVLEFEVIFQENVSFRAMQRVFAAISAGLRATGNQEVWGFAARPYRSPLFGGFREYTVRAELINDRGQVVAETSFTVRSRILQIRRSLFADTSQRQRPSFRPIHVENDLTGNMAVRIVSIDGIAVETAMQDGYVEIIPAQTLPRVRVRNPLVVLTRSVL